MPWSTKCANCGHNVGQSYGQWQHRAPRNHFRRYCGYHGCKCVSPYSSVFEAPIARPQESEWVPTQRNVPWKKIIAVLAVVLILGVAAYNYQTIETGIVSYASNMPSTTKNTTVTTSLVGATICSHGFWASLLDANCIDASWVHEFMANISLMGRVSFTENTQLDQLAQERFNTAVTQPDITHYGGNSEIPPGVGEVIYYPAGSSPSAYAHNDVQKGAPGHYNLMVSYGFTQYGYYLGQGKIAESSGCSVTELPGPDINVTQFLQQHGCQVTWVTSTWLVIDMR